MVAQRALKFGQHRHPARPSVPAFEVARGEADRRDKLAVAENVAHSQREYLVDAKSRELLHGDQRPIARLQLADDAEKLAFLLAG